LMWTSRMGVREYFEDLGKTIYRPFNDADTFLEYRQHCKKQTSHELTPQAELQFYKEKYKEYKEKHSELVAEKQRLSSVLVYRIFMSCKKVYIIVEKEGVMEFFKRVVAFFKRKF